MVADHQIKKSLINKIIWQDIQEQNLEFPGNLVSQSLVTTKLWLKNRTHLDNMGNFKRRAKQSEYGIQLQEKQKAKYLYGILEKQFSNLFKEALRRKGITGEILLQLCELRLDNTVYRLGFAPTRRAARQLVSHKHILLNGEVCNIPSYSLTIGDVVSVRERSKSLEVITDSLKNNSCKVDWLELNIDKISGKINSFFLKEFRFRKILKNS